jgi:hypothetical protein
LRRPTHFIAQNGIEQANPKNVNVPTRTVLDDDEEEEDDDDEDDDDAVLARDTDLGTRCR